MTNHREHKKRGNVRVSRDKIILQPDDLKVMNKIAVDEYDSKENERLHQLEIEVRERVKAGVNTAQDKEFLRRVENGEWRPEDE